MADIRFYVNDALTHNNVGRLFPSSYSFNGSVAGNGALQLTMPHNPRPSENTLIKRLKPNRYEVMVCIGEPTDNNILWAGFMHTRDPVRSAPQITLVATSWRGWLFQRLVPPGTFGKKNHFEKDEYQIAYDLIDWACAPAAAPNMGHYTTDADYDTTFTVSDWASVGESLDNLGKRWNGFEWDVVPSWDSSADKLRLDFRLWEHGETRRSNNWLMIDSEDNSTSNIGGLTENGSQQATRVWATSDGDNPIVVSDSDPSLGLYGTLLLEVVSSYQDEPKKSVLFDHAHAERIARNFPYSTLPVTVFLDKPKIQDYTYGDRVRIRIRDQWNNISADGVRILDVSVSKESGGIATATLTLDLTDILGRDSF